MEVFKKYRFILRQPEITIVGRGLQRGTPLESTLSCIRNGEIVGRIWGTSPIWQETLDNVESPRIPLKRNMDNWKTGTFSTNQWNKIPSQSHNNFWAGI